MIKKRTYLDILTMLAMLAIAISNVTNDVWNGISEINGTWDLYGCLTVATRWGLPLLISTIGIVCLDRDMAFSNRTVYCKLLPQAVISCVVWWSVSALIYLKTNFPNEIDIDTFLECMGSVLESPYNIGILQMIVMLFAFYPLLMRIVKKDNLVTYAVITAFVICMVFPMLENIPYVRYVTLFTNQINWNFFTPYTLYLFLGVWISRKNFEWHHRVVIYCLGLLSTVAMFALTKIYSAGLLDLDSRFINDNSPLVALQVLSIITAIKHLFKKDIQNRTVRDFFTDLSKNRYGYIALYMIGFGFVSDFITEEHMILLIPACFLFVNGLCLILRRLPIISYLIGDYENVR